MDLKSKLILLKESNHKTITNPVYLFNPEPTTLYTNKIMQILTNSYLEASQKSNFQHNCPIAFYHLGITIQCETSKTKACLGTKQNFLQNIL